VILGNRKPGVTAVALAANTQQLIDVTLPRSGYLVDMTVYLDGTAGSSSQPVAGTLYNAVTNTLVVVGQTVMIVPGKAAGWVALPFATHPLLLAGAYTVGIHGMTPATARFFHSGGAGRTMADATTSARSDLATSATSTGPTLYATVDEVYVPPAVASDEYLAALPYPEAQALFSLGGPLQGTTRAVNVGWHGTRTDPAQGSFAVVQEGSVLEDLFLGERVRVTYGNNSTCVYVHDSMAILEDLSLTRRNFMDLADPCVDSLAAKVEVLA
jgi:hypothetical protein